MSTGGGGHQDQQPAVAPVPVFALGPGQGINLLDYTDTSHIKMY